MGKPLRVLLIGESPGYLLEMFSGCGHDIELIHREQSGDVPAIIAKDGIDIVFFDFADGRGTAAFDRLRRAVPGVPIIVLVAAADDPAATHAMRNGAQDYLVRGKIDAELLSRAIRYALEHTRMEAAQRRSEAMYQRLVENLNEGIIVVDRSGLITFANPAMEEILGCPVDHLVGSPVAWFIDAPPSAADNLFFRETGERQEFELNLLNSGGGRVPVLVVTSPITDESGTFQSSIAGILDITRRKHAEEEIRIKNEQLMVLNQVVGVSAASLSLTELLEETLEKMLDLMGHHLGIVYMFDSGRKRAVLQHQRGLPPSVLPRNCTVRVHHWPFNLTFVAGRPHYIERRSDLPPVETAILDEFEVAALACIPLVAESVVAGAVYVGSRTQDSFSPEERTLLEMVGKEIGAGILKGMLHRRLEAANREANLYLDIMAHDIRNTENVSGLYADLLIEMLDGEGALYARKIRDSIDRSKEILGNVATIRCIHHDSLETAPVDLAAVVREEVAAFPGVEIEYGAGRRRVWADELLSEVFANLIRNAVSFGGPNVRIVIREEDYDGESVLVSVEDTGPGIPDPLKEVVFHRFEREWVGGGGDGLGLFIVRTLIERYGGTIRVEDRVEGHPELGSAFRFTLREVQLSREDDDDGHPDSEGCG